MAANETSEVYTTPLAFIREHKLDPYSDQVRKGVETLIDRNDHLVDSNAPLSLTLFRESVLHECFYPS
jgi:hypothetical protein